MTSLKLKVNTAWADSTILWEFPGEESMVVISLFVVNFSRIVSIFSAGAIGSFEKRKHSRLISSLWQRFTAYSRSEGEHPRFFFVLSSGPNGRLGMLTTGANNGLSTSRGMANAPVRHIPMAPIPGPPHSS